MTFVTRSRCLRPGRLTRTMGGVGTAPLPSRFRSSSGGRVTLMVLIVAFGAEVGGLMAEPPAS